LRAGGSEETGDRMLVRKKNTNNVARKELLHSKAEGDRPLLAKMVAHLPAGKNRGKVLLYYEHSRDTTEAATPERMWGRINKNWDVFIMLGQKSEGGTEILRKYREPKATNA